MLYYQTVYGRYWSSSIVSGTHSYYLIMYNALLAKANINNKRLGFPLRCVISCPTMQRTSIVLIDSIRLNQTCIVHV